MMFGRNNTPHITMRSALAVLMTAALLTIVTGCSLMACAFSTGSSHACCHKHQNGRMPCGSQTAMQQCAYTLLERGRTVTANSSGPAPAAVAAIYQPVRTALSKSTYSPARLVDSAGLFLRNRVLLI